MASRGVRRPGNGVDWSDALGPPPRPSPPPRRLSLAPPRCPHVAPTRRPATSRPPRPDFPRLTLFSPFLASHRPGVPSPSLISPPLRCPASLCRSLVSASFSPPLLRLPRPASRRPPLCLASLPRPSSLTSNRVTRLTSPCLLFVSASSRLPSPSLVPVSSCLADISPAATTGRGHPLTSPHNPLPVTTRSLPLPTKSPPQVHPRSPPPRRPHLPTPVPVVTPLIGALAWPDGRDPTRTRPAHRHR